MPKRKHSLRHAYKIGHNKYYLTIKTPKGVHLWEGVVTYEQIGKGAHDYHVSKEGFNFISDRETDKYDVMTVHELSLLLRSYGIDTTKFEEEAKC